MMKVYSSGNFWGHDKGDVPLTPLPVNQTFVWEEIDGIFPAIYLGESGVVLDLCIRVPLDRLEMYLEKWDNVERLSNLTDEDYEQMEQDNPCTLDFRVGLLLDGVELQQAQMCSTVWHPLEVENACVEEEAKKLREEYNCDRSWGWEFVRCMYRWKSGVNVAPRNIRLQFQGMQTPVTVGYFSTETDCEGQKIEAVHPVTGEAYVITLHGLREERLPRETLENMDSGRGMEYPVCYHVLSYRTAPETTPEELRICDCAKSDRPIVKKEGTEPGSAAVAVIGGADGPTSIFMAGRRTDKTFQAAMSALHFKPVRKIRWRIVFQVRKRKNLELDFEVGTSLNR